MVCIYWGIQYKTFYGCNVNVNKCLNTKIYSYFETSGSQSSNIYLNVIHFSTLVLVRHLWQLKTALFLNWCLIHVVLLLPYCYKLECLTLPFTSTLV